MKKSFVKMNDNKKFLSLGNLFNCLKTNSVNKSSAMQSELFCSIFQVEFINNTTVNNYCIGYRAISMDYKKIYYNFKREFESNKLVLVPIIIGIVSILNEHIYTINDDALSIINNDIRLKNVIGEMIIIAKNDINISNNFIGLINDHYNNGNLYEAFCHILFYTILENKQPINNNKLVINSDELNAYLQINLNEGVSYINSLKELAKKGNMYANAELGSLEYSGLITGNRDDEMCFNYYLEAAKKNHPKAAWMVANLIYYDKVKCKDVNLAFKYINIAIQNGSVAAINSLGNFYKSGFTPDGIIDLEKAQKCYLESSEYEYAFAFNNLGVLCEEEGKEEEALAYFKHSCDLNESWALNHVGEYYRKKGNWEEALFYYEKAIQTPILETYYYAYYNLAKYFYLNGNKYLKIKKDTNKALSFLSLASSKGVSDAAKLLKELEVKNV